MVIREKFHYTLYIGSLLTIAIALPLSMFVMTIGICVLFCNALLEWNWKEKWERLKSNRVVFWIISFPLLFFIGFINTDHYALGLESYLMKLPMLLIPLSIVTSKPLQKKEIRWVFLVYIGSLFFTTLYSIYYLNTHIVNDIREISRFISHIRFSLNIVFGIVILSFLIWDKEWRNRKIIPIYVLILIWFVLYLFIAQTLTGIVILFILVLYLMVYILFRFRKKKEFKVLTILFLLFVLTLVTYISVISYQYFYNKDQNQELEKFTKLGNPYWHNLDTWVENGHMIGYYVNRTELEEEWSKRSLIPMADVEQGLIRYLNSMGLRKDAEGVQQLSDRDISYIEKGYANIDYTRGIGLKRSLYPTFFSLSLYQKFGKIHQSSLLERFELWKASGTLIQKNWLFGVGVGDHKFELDQQLEKQQSEITKKLKGCHNQFLTIWMSGGIFLLLLFLIMLFAPLYFRIEYKLIYILFFVIIFISMFTEDTINTHAGVTFFSFFNSFLLFCLGRKPSEQEIQIANK